MIGVATIFDNLDNEGALLQGHCMLTLMGAQGVLFDRNLSGSRPGCALFRQTLNLSPRFTHLDDVARHINATYSLLVVGSDEVWKIAAAPGGNRFLFPFPNHLVGADIDIPRVALAASSGSVNFGRLSSAVLDRLREHLLRFDLIYVRDAKTARNLRRLEIPIAGELPDPTFAFQFSAPPLGLDPDRCYELPKGRIEQRSHDPITWLVAHAEMSSAIVHRMHSLISCLRGNTPCLIRDRRSKTRSLAKAFGLPESCWGDSITRVKDEWPSDRIEATNERYQQKWKSVFTELEQRYRLAAGSDDTSGRRPGATLAAPQHGSSV
ncbi:MAG: polysaccharide pyruvyl transferase family protein [Planctomycetaceae bacterium]|nr:polysaccharide pyruvyl transferase family protein [Planctomycetaceae bacterium]